METLNTTLTAHSALHSIYEAQGARIDLRDGWRVPLHFGSTEEEVETAQRAVAVAERIGIHGLDLVGEALPELAARLAVGEVPWGAAAAVTLTEAGEARWLRLTRTHARLLTSRDVHPEQVSSLVPPPPGLGEGDRGWGPAGRCLHLRDVSSGFTTLAVIGPRSPDLLARLIRLDTDPRVFADHSVALTGAIGIPLQLLRWDRGPLLAYELAVGRDAAEYFWEALTHAGQNLGLKPIGTEALSRIEGVRR